MRIRVTTQRDGRIFSIDPRDLTSLEGSGAEPASKIFFGHDTRDDFDFYHGKEERLRQVVYLLTGLSGEKLRQYVDAIDFLDSRTGETLVSVRKDEL